MRAPDGASTREGSRALSGNSVAHRPRPQRREGGGSSSHLGVWETRFISRAGPLPGGASSWRKADVSSSGFHSEEVNLGGRDEPRETKFIPKPGAIRAERPFYRRAYAKLRINI